MLSGISRIASAAALCLGAVVLFLAVPQANAGIIYSTGFENPPFVLGPLAGQDGWQEFGTTPVMVENTVVKSGLQAVSVDGSAAGQSGPFHEDPTAGPLVELQADLFLAGSTTQSSWQFAGLGSGLAPFIGGIDTDPSTNDIKLITAGFPVVGTFSRDVWHHVDFVFNFTTQTYSFSFDGTQLAMNVPFCGDNGPCNGGLVGSYGDGLFDTFGGGNDFGYMDNFSLGTLQAVPEPGTLALLASGLMGVAAAVRRRISR